MQGRRDAGSELLQGEAAENQGRKVAKGCRSGRCGYRGRDVAVVVGGFEGRDLAVVGMFKEGDIAKDIRGTREGRDIAAVARTT